MKAPLIKKQSSSDAGFSVLELLIVGVMISVLIGFAITQIARAKQHMTRANAVRELTTYIEKARLPFRPSPCDQQRPDGAVAIINANFYSVTFDGNGDGTLDAPQLLPCLPIQTSRSRMALFPGRSCSTGAVAP